MFQLTTPHRGFSSGAARLVAVALGVGLAAATLSSPAIATASPVGQLTRATVAQAEDDEVVLPSRVHFAIGRTERALGRAEAAIDDRRRPAARRALHAVAVNARRAHDAGMRQMSAPPADPEAETTAGPDSVVAVLSLDQMAITRLAGMVDGVKGRRIVLGVKRAMRASLDVRSRMLTAVIGLDPEGVGADYADGMADTVDGFADEVSSLQEALAVDRLTHIARKTLVAALGRSIAAQLQVTLAFGGGE